MALRKSNQAICRMSAPSALDAVGAVSVLATFVTVASEFAANDVIEMIPWPAGTIPVMLKAKVEDLDSDGTPAVTLDFGVLTGQWLENTVGNDGSTARECGTDFAAASTVGQAGGAVDVAANLLLGLVPEKQKDRSIGFKVAAAPDVLVAGAKITVAALFVPSPVNVAFA
jgi:hypothetical protein